jgi:hypothetical protein
MSLVSEEASGEGVEIVKRQLPLPPDDGQVGEATVFSMGSDITYLFLGLF